MSRHITHDRSLSHRFASPLAATGIAAALLLSACGPDTELTSDLPGYETPVTQSDTTVPELDATVAHAQAFINGAGQSSLMQTSIGELALLHATRADVRDFAQLMIDQHRASFDALAAAAAAAALAPPPMTLGEELQRSVNALAPPPAADAVAEPGTPGDTAPVETAPVSDFDTEYLAKQVNLHETTIRAYEAYAGEGRIEPLRIFADQSLPGLRDNLARVREIQAAASPPS